MPAIRGSCLCGGVKFAINGPLLRPLNCHCSLCRKQHGAAFRSRARVRRRDFKWLRGEELVTYYEATPGYRRGFCRICGSPIVNRAEPHSHLAQNNPQTLTEFGIALGVLDDDPGVRPESHIFVGSKAPWFEIIDDLPQFERYPPVG
ncbi:MAG TPA: GFA family protein [Stellaceae bacterium]|nr:GFA family protein [Stellaceae bacterium]